MWILGADRRFLITKILASTCMLGKRRPLPTVLACAMTACRVKRKLVPTQLVPPACMAFTFASMPAAIELAIGKCVLTVMVGACPFL
jgi:hypothetical protein